jgi:hypothetical protein
MQIWWNVDIARSTKSFHFKTCNATLAADGDARQWWGNNIDVLYCLDLGTCHTLLCCIENEPYGEALRNIGYVTIVLAFSLVKWTVRGISGGVWNWLVSLCCEVT